MRCDSWLVGSRRVWTLIIIIKKRYVVVSLTRSCVLYRGFAGVDVWDFPVRILREKKQARQHHCMD